MQVGDLVTALTGDRPPRLDAQSARLALADLAATHPELLAMGLSRARARAVAAGRSAGPIDRAVSRHCPEDDRAAAGRTPARGGSRLARWMRLRVRGASAAADAASREMKAAAWSHEARLAADMADLVAGKRPPARPETGLALDAAIGNLDRAMARDREAPAPDHDRPDFGRARSGRAADGAAPGLSRDAPLQPPPVIDIAIRIPDPGLVGAEHARRVAQDLETVLRGLDPAELLARRDAARLEASRRRGPAGSILADELSRGVELVERVAADRGIGLPDDAAKAGADPAGRRRRDQQER
ncbi:MAG: hypothetical protein J0H82_26200 [Alphaproteobacteria bacterium]|jgi:hypothetical protein|nr:hypothetical protein [Alphaproteobacteria bacterium]